MAYLGLASGVVLCALLWQPLRQIGAVLFLTLATLTILLSLPAWYRRWPRPLRDMLRFAMGVTIALCAHLLLSGQLLVGLVGALALTTFWKAYMVLRRSRRLVACAGCPELHANVICTGFTLQAERVRRYEIAATERIIGFGNLPLALRVGVMGNASRLGPAQNAH
jgi:hypothetical protein